MSWEKIKFKDLYSITSRNGLTKPSRIRGRGHKFINMGELFGNDRIKNPKMELVPLSEKEKTTHKIAFNDLLFARQSLIFSGAGKCSIVKEVDDLTVYDSHIIRVRLKDCLCSPDFYYYYFKTPLCDIKSIVQQGVQAGIRGSDLAKLNVDFPPLPTQQKIASILGAYDDLIENNLKRIQLLEEAAQNLYKEWFVNFRFPGHENHPINEETGLPEGWERQKLGDLCELIHGYSFKAKEFSNTKEKYLVIRMGNFKENGGLQLNKNLRYLKSKGNLKDKYILKSGDLVMVLSDVTRDGRIIGNVGFIPDDNRIYLLNQRVAKIKINEEFKHIIYSDLNSIRFKDYCKPRANGATVLNLKTKDILDYKILIPNKNIKSHFTKLVSRYITNIENLIKQNQQLQEARDLLLPRLMNQEIEVETE